MGSPDDDTPEDIRRSIEEAEGALVAATPERAADFLARADAPMGDVWTARFARCLVTTNRFLSRQADTVDWIESRLPGTEGPLRAELLRCRIAALRSLDTRRVLELVGEAIAAADDQGDEIAVAELLGHAAFAAYRRNDVRAAERHAAVAAARAFTAPEAMVQALRAQGFAAITAGRLERALDLCRDVRRRGEALGDQTLVANESNNVAEHLLRLGLHDEAAIEARRAMDEARRAGHRTVERYGAVLLAESLAESGDLDGGIAGLRPIDLRANPSFEADRVAALSFYLVERGGADDFAESLYVAGRAADEAGRAGITHIVTRLRATQARAVHRMGARDEARELLGAARRAVEAADAFSELHLALAVAEVLPESDPARRASVGGARSRILRAAALRDDPVAYCTGVLLHRRLLELTGGVPDDLHA